jgi:hypothetical protein
MFGLADRRVREDARAVLDKMRLCRSRYIGINPDLMAERVAADFPERSRKIGQGCAELVFADCTDFHSIQHQVPAQHRL